MAHYRKIDTRILLDKKFNALSSDARLVFFHLLAHINLTSLGAMHASVPGLADELNWEVARFESALLALCENDMAHYDKTARFLWLPNFLKYNVPESPNVVKSWETALSYLPECALRDALVVHVQQFVAGLSLSFQEALPHCFQAIASSFENDAAKMQSVSKSETVFGEMPSESYVKAVTPPSESLTKALENPSESAIEGVKIPSENPLHPLLEGSFENGLPLPESLSIKHKALNNQHKTLSIKQEERELIQENHLEEKEKMEEIKNIVALTQPKNAKRRKPPDGEVVDVFRCWQKTLGHPHAVLDGKRRKRIRQALASGYSVLQLCDAILGCSQTPHNMGDNEQGQCYDGLHVILRDADQIDRFIRNAHSPPKKQNAADKTITTGRSWLDKKIREKQAQTEKTIYECA